MNQMELSSILADITVIRQQGELLRKYKGYGFNLIRLLGAETDEVKICRLLYELLSPKGSHSQGRKFLRLFYSMVLGKNFSEEVIASSWVYREKSIRNRRRIDLFIEAGAYKFPIEVKIYADDQKDQCKDYFQYAKAPNGEEPTMYYLTLDGHQPSDYSIGPANFIHVVPLSFAEDIIAWLDACAKEVPDTVRLRESISQIKQIIEEICGIMSDEEQDGIVSVLKKSYDNFQSAAKIPDAIKRLKDGLLIKIFSEIDEKVQQATHQTRLDNKYDYTQRVSSFYGSTGQNPPGISYLYKGLQNDIQIWVRAEISKKGLWVTYCHVKVDADKRPAEYGHYIDAVEVCRAIPNVAERDVPNDNQWWIVDDKKFGFWEDEYPGREWPNFWECNESWFELLDDKQRDSYTTVVANRIVKLLRNQQSMKTA